MTNNVKVQRVIKNIGQSELAAKLGVSRQTIHAIESGKFVPSTLLALKLAQVFEIPVEEIFRLEVGD
jgi:putative transcriptional regulator